MKEITAPIPPEFERVVRFQALQAGHYWRAVSAVPLQGVAMGEVLLIQSIRWVDNAAHTIILRPHPNKFGTSETLKVPQADGSIKNVWIQYNEHRFLLREFLDSFEFEPDHQAVRLKEIATVQGRTADLQKEIMDFQTDPQMAERIIQEAMVAVIGHDKTTDDEGAALFGHTGGLISNAIGNGLTADGVASMRQAVGRELEISTIKSKWLTAKNEEIASTIKALLPYYSEFSAAALALTEESFAQVAKLQSGIESLDLYVGTGVEVTTISEGASAAESVPLTFVQRRMAADVEMVTFAPVGSSFDFTEISSFYNALRTYPDLVNQIFPTERCVVVMSTTERDIDYGNAYTNVALNEKNKNVFLLIRDGGNIHQVHSPVTSHLKTSRLFPSFDEQESIFKGVDGSQVRFDDVAYTDKLSAHSQHALHYKRFLILCAGLDHRLRLFGTFYEGPQSFHFVTLKFQEDHCRFLHDDDGSGLLGGIKRPSLAEYFKAKNAYMRSGSRILCNWGELLTPDTAPGACRAAASGDDFRRLYTPANETDVLIAYQDGPDLCVDIEVSGYSQSSGKFRRFLCKVNISQFRPHYWRNTERAFLCLDAVAEDEIYWYIRNRESRSNFISYIKFFKSARVHLIAEAEAETGARAQLAQALVDGGVTSEKDAPPIIQQAVIAWRAANRGKPLSEAEASPKAWKSLLDQLYMLAGEGQRRVSEIEAWAEAQGRKPLRFVLSGAGAMQVYLEPLKEERDDRLDPHAWVHLATIARSKKRIVEKGRRWAVLPANAASETVVHDWPEATQWTEAKSVFPSYARKQAVLGAVDQSLNDLEAFVPAVPMSPSKLMEYVRLWHKCYSEASKKAKQVQVIPLQLVIGVIAHQGGYVQYLCASQPKAHAFLYSLASDDETRSLIRDLFMGRWANKQTASATFANDVKSPRMWDLAYVAPSLLESGYGPFTSDMLGIPSHGAQGFDRVTPLLSSWFERFKETAVRENRLIYIAEELIGENGRLDLDSRLSNQTPDGYEPLYVYHFNTSNHKGDLSVTEWYDICPADTEEEVVNRLHDGKSYSRRAYQADSRVAAHNLIKSVTEESDSGALLVPAIQITDAVQPPEGVERWLVVKK